VLLLPRRRPAWNIHNYWAKKEVKLISFELDNDQQYYAYVPKDAEVGSLYEVKLTEVEKIEGGLVFIV